MAVFRFQFETVLRHRRSLEEARLRELRALADQRAAMQAEIRGLQEAITRSRRELGGSLIGKVDLVQVARFAQFGGQTRFRVQGIALGMAALERSIGQATQLVVEARRDRRALEVLRERRFEAWKREQDRREAVELDDLSAGVSARTVMEAGA